MKEPPFKCEKILSLTSFDIPTKCLSFSCISAQKNGNLVIVNKDEQQIIIVNIAGQTKRIFDGFQADHASMDLDNKTLAIYHGRSLSFVSLDSKQILQQVTVEDNIDYIKWFPSNHLFIVSKKHYHMWDGSKCSSLYERSSEMLGLQIVDVALHRDGWCAISGIKPRDGRISGNVHLFSISKTYSGHFEGHCGGFLAEGNKSSFVVYSTDLKTSLKIIDLDNLNNSETLDVFLPPLHDRDFPIKLVMDTKIGLVYIVMKSGSTHVYDYHAKMCLQIFDASETPIFAVFEGVDAEFCVIDRHGNVTSVLLDPQNLVHYIGQSLGLFDLNMKYAKIFGLKVEADALKDAAGRYLRNQQLEKAISVYKAASAIEQEDMMSYFESQNLCLEDFIFELVKYRVLAPFESAILFKDNESIRQNLGEISELIASGKIECTEELGNLLSPIDEDLALSVYIRSQSKTKALMILSKSLHPEKINLYIKRLGCEVSVRDLIQFIPSEQDRQKFLNACMDDLIQVSPKSVAEYIMHNVETSELDKRLAEFIMNHDELKSDSEVCTAAVMRLMIHSSHLALDLLEAGVSVDKEVLRDHLNQNCSWKLAFVLETDEKKIQLAIDNADHDSIEWCLINSSSAVQLDMLRKLLISKAGNRIIEHYLEFVGRNKANIDLNHEVDLLWEINCHQLVPKVVGSVNQLNEESSQLHYFQSLLKSSRWDLMENEIINGSLVNGNLLFENLISMNPSDPVGVIILAKRLGISKELLHYLWAHHHKEVSFAYIAHISPDDIGLLIEQLIKDENELEKYLSSNSNTQSDWRIRAAETMLRLQKFKCITTWAENDLTPFANCPILATIYCEALILSNQPVYSFLAMKAADFSHLKKLSTTADNYLAYALCCWQMGDYMEAFEAVFKHELYDEAANISLNEKGCSFPALWNDEMFISHVIEVIDKALITDKLAQKIKNGDTNFLSVMSGLSAADRLQHVLIDSISKIDKKDIPDQSIIDITVYFACINLELARNFARDYGTEQLIRKGIEVLKRLGYLKPAGELSLETSENHEGICLLLKSGADLNRVIDIVKQKNDLPCWKVLGQYLLGKSMYSEPILKTSIVNGDITVDDSCLVNILDHIQSRDRLEFVKHLWGKGHHSQTSCSLLIKESLVLADSDTLQWAIDKCEVVNLIMLIGKECFGNKLYEIAIKAFTKSKSADWTVLALIESSRLDEVSRFVRLVQNPLVLAYTFERILETFDSVKETELSKLLLSILKKDRDYQKLLVDILRKSKALSSLLSFVNMSDLCEEARYIMLQGLVLSGLYTEGSFSEHKSDEQLFADLEFWDLLSQHSIQDFDRNHLDDLISRGFCFLPDPMQEHILMSHRSEKTISLRPDLFVRNNIPIHKSYWISRHTMRTTGDYKLDTTEVLEKKDFAILRILLESGKCDILKSYESKIMDIPMKKLFIRYHLSRKNFDEAVALLLDMHEYLAAIDIAIRSHSKETCRYVLTRFVTEKNHTMLFVSSMAFNGIIKDDTVIEYAWKSGVYNKFVPFTCQYMYERS